MNDERKEASPTLDQQRAALAWGYATEGIGQSGSEYKSLAKGAPALIMNSGLMATLAFYNAKKTQAASALLDHLICGISKRLSDKFLNPGQGSQLFAAYMQSLHAGSSHDYLRHTEEALELLKWIRQFVDAVEPARN